MCVYLGINGGVKIDLMVLILNQSWVYVGDDTDSTVWRFVIDGKHPARISQLKIALRTLDLFHTCYSKRCEPNCW